MTVARLEVSHNYGEDMLGDDSYGLFVFRARVFRARAGWD
jgi:hypothetical protein